MQQIEVDLMEFGFHSSLLNVKHLFFHHHVTIDLSGRRRIMGSATLCRAWRQRDNVICESDISRTRRNFDRTALTFWTASRVAPGRTAIYRPKKSWDTRCSDAALKVGV